MVSLQAPMSRATRALTRRHKVVAAARKLFVVRGFHNTGIAQIAVASGVKVGQIYRDFPSKEAIIATIVELDFAALVSIDPLRTALERGDRIDLLTQFERLLEPGLSTEILPEILAEAARNPEIAKIVDVLEECLHATLTGALAVFAPGKRMRSRREQLASGILALTTRMCPHAGAADTCRAAMRAIIMKEIKALAVVGRGCALQAF